MSKKWSKLTRNLMIILYIMIDINNTKILWLSRIKDLKNTKIILRVIWNDQNYYIQIWLIL